MDVCACVDGQIWVAAKCYLLRSNVLGGYILTYIHMNTQMYNCILNLHFIKHRLRAVEILIRRYCEKIINFYMSTQCDSRTYTCIHIYVNILYTKLTH